MKSVLTGIASLLLATSAAAGQEPGPWVPGPDGACEVRPDAPYVNPRLPLGRAAYARRPACRTTLAPGPDGPGLYVQGPPLRVEAAPVRIGGLRIYLVPPEVIVAPSVVTVEPPEIQTAPPADRVSDSGD